MNNQPQNIEIINLKEIALKHLKKWPWFIATTGLSLVIALLYLLSTNTTYSVESTILIRDDNNRQKLSQMAIVDGFGVQPVEKEVEDEMRIIGSKTILTEVIRDLDISTEYYVKNRLRYTDIYPVKPFELLAKYDISPINPQQVLILKIQKSNSNYRIDLRYGEQKEKLEVSDLSKPIKTLAGILKLTPNKDFDEKLTYKIIDYPMMAITNILSQSIQINTINKKTNAVKISTVSANPAKAQAIINKLVELYNLDAVLDKNIIATNTKEFVEKRLELLKNELLDVEISVETYKKQNNMTDLTTQAEYFMRTTGEYNKELSRIETQLNLADYIKKHLNESENKYSLIPANLGVQDGALQTLIKNYNDALLERLKISRTSNAMNPLITQLEEQISTMRSSIIASVASVTDGLMISKRDLKKKESQFTGKIKEIPTQEREYIDIKRQQEIKNNLYIFLLQKREENALALASTNPSAKTLDKAYIIPIPVAPKKIIILLIALIIGLLIPIAVIYVLDLFDQTIKDKKELQRLTKVPYLGSISKVKEGEKVVVGEGKTTPIAEMFRLIRTNLQFMLSSKPSHVMLITSAGSGEGKSFTAINLAITLALTNKKVLLMGLDIRMPALGKYLNISERSGITHYLSNENLTIDEITIKSELHKNLHIVLAGTIPPNPTELLMSYRLDEMIEELRSKYDYIVMDSAPLGVVSDTYLLNRLSDNVLFVCRQNYTPRDATDLINEVYQKSSLNGMGLILNAVDKISEYGYGYGHKRS